MVVVDEAYIDYAGEAESCLGLVDRFRNVVVMQTFSKAWGLAGARVGFAVASPELVAVIDRVKAPFNLSVLAEEATTRVIAAAETVRSQRDTLLLERKRVCDTLSAPAFARAVHHIVPSDANFLLVKMARCKEICEQLCQEDGVILRYRGSMLHCDDCVRISIGTRDENDRMLAALARVIGDSSFSG